MKILFTGASSFTGLWFVQELAKAGHKVTACFRSDLGTYSGIRRKRVELALELCQPVFNCPFGSDEFIKAVKNGNSWDLFCHHGADVTNYKDPSFDAVAALSNNTRNLKNVLKALSEKGCQKILLTGSVFEQNEGSGTELQRAVSPYGLSKGLTSDLFRHYTEAMGLKLGKFVIPNPFGPYEEARFTSYLIQAWLQGKTAAVNTPDYVRDNIHVTLLAKAYCNFAERLTASPGYEKHNPSGYAESQGAFTKRFAQEMRPRLGLECQFECKSQREFAEPKVRINMDALDISQLGWDEAKAWDNLAVYYQDAFQ